MLSEWAVAAWLPDDCVECVTADHITNIPDWQLRLDENMRFAAIASHEDAVLAEGFLGLGPGEYRSELELELAKLASAHPGRFNRFVFDSTLHTTTAADSQAGAPEGVATFDETRVGGTSVAQWLESLLDDDPAFGDLVE